MQAVVQVAGAPATALFDSGAGGGNYISKRYCSINGIKLTTATTPISVVGVLQSAADASSCCKLTVRMSALSDTLVFYAIDMPGTFDLIIGDTWLHDRQAIMDFPKSCCHVYKNGRKYTILMSAKLNGSTPADEQNDEPAGDSNAAATPHVIGYAEAKRILHKGPGVWHSMVVVRDKKPDIPVTVGTVVSSGTTPGDAPANTPLQADLLAHGQVQDIVSSFPEVFTDEPPHGGSQIELDVEVIPFEGEKPILRPMFRYSPLEMQEMQKQIGQLLQLGYIQPSSSPFGCPVLFVKKPRSTELRMVIDYRHLNRLTKRNGFPLPRIDVLLDHLAGAKVFSLVDLRQAYHQCKLQPTDVPKTAFRTPFGHYEFLTLSFGLVNAPAAFQSVMNRIFSPMLYKYCLVYLDDILIFSKSAAEHAVHLRAVLDVLKANSLTVAIHKCTLNQPSVLFLGHIVSAAGVAADPSKVTALQDFPIPQDVSHLRSFLGTTNFFRKFIRHYAEVLLPMTHLLRKDAPFEWSVDCQTSFEWIKHLLTTAPVLALPEWNSGKPFHMICDASYDGVGGVLLQDSKPIAFESRKLIPAELNYSPTELEMLAIVYCCQKWRVYIEGRDVHVHTDHKPNVTFDTVNMANRRHARWLDALQGHRLVWHYVKGVTNPADSLSRYPVCFVGMLANQPLHFVGTAAAVLNPLQSLSDSVSFLERIKAAYKLDPWFNLENTAALTFTNGLYFRGTTLVLPFNADLQHAAIAECHNTMYSAHAGRTKTLHKLRQYFWWPVGMAAAVRKYVSTCSSCQRVKASNAKPAGLLQPLSVPADTWLSVGMDLVTDLPLTSSNHDSIAVFVDRLSKMVHLAPCRKDTTAEQFADIFLDTVVKHHGLPDELVSDRGSIWTSKFWQALRGAFGISSAMSTAYHPQSDGNTERVNRIMEDMMRHFVDPSQSNWVQLLPLVEFAINDSWQESVQAVPFVLNYGKRPHLPLDKLLKGEGRLDVPDCVSAAERAESILSAVKNAKAALHAAQQRQAVAANRRRRDMNILVGDSVFLSTVNIKMKFKGSPKLLPRWIGPFKVLEQINPVAFRLELPSNLKVHNVFHISLLKPVAAGTSIVAVPPPTMIDGELEYEVEVIVSHRFVGHGKLQFLVKWLSYGVEHNTWEPEANCANCPEKVSEYWSAVQSQSGMRLVAAPHKKQRKNKRSAQSAALPAARATQAKRRRK
eukprot:GHRQ01000930.1.p1 GENE.GHRQ01000930.1~~GHRQ01000930.1.p1  ORF type:complete len:1344 (+),score=98.92 GHRQ01000930.1:408-4034(+)